MKKESVTVNLDAVLVDIIRRRAKAEGRSLSGMVAFAARRYFEIMIRNEADINGGGESEND